MPTILTRLQQRLTQDDGVTTVEVLAWSAVLVVVIVGIGAALRALGVDVIGSVRNQIGL